MKKITSFCLLLIITFSALFLSGCPDDYSGNDYFDSTPKKKLEIISELSSNVTELSVYYNLEITGTAKNVSGGNLSYAQLTFTVYDSDDNQIGTALANINNLAADTTWKFKATGILHSAPSRYVLSEISAW